MRKILVVIGSRANYGSIKSCLKAIDEHSDLQLILVVGGSAVLDKFGNVSENIINDGFKIDEKIFYLLEGGDNLSMAKSTGVALIELANSFSRLKPDLVLTIGDRYETMATVLAATYLNIPLAHTMGGEVSGTIDESIRHAITKFASIHFAANLDASERIIKMGELPEFVYNVGCPRIDLVDESIKKYENLSTQNLLSNGVGQNINIESDFLLISQHPVTTEYEKNQEYMKEILEAITETKIPCLILWPNSDAGSDGISKAIRIWREKYPDLPFKYSKNFDSSFYFYLMSKCKVMIGNSSSGIREGSFIGTPVVNVGSRQNGRVRSNNVIDVKPYFNEIINAINSQIRHGRYKSSNIYGDGNAANKIANILADQEEFQIQKTISY